MSVKLKDDEVSVSQATRDTQITYSSVIVRFPYSVVRRTIFTSSFLISNSLIIYIKSNSYTSNRIQFALKGVQIQSTCNVIFLMRKQMYKYVHCRIYGSCMLYNVLFRKQSIRYEKSSKICTGFLQISAMLPTEFEQVYIRLYWKGDENQTPDEQILTKFHEMKSKTYIHSI